MYTFQPYDPSRPRTVCSFKGNQKLIFEGYRYNIHHIVPAKGVKTWRCVCAKKLNGTRSWCKGRAETWDNDENGTSKGEHNHPAEHEVAELEFFKSQLIIAAISCPQINLNELIDKAASLMTTGGENFGNRESLKKSLTSARKQSENGGFKLKSYKNICNNNNKNNKTILKKKNIKEEEEEKIILKENCEILKKTENIEDNNKFKNEEENYLNLFKTPTTTKPSPSLSSTLFSSFYSSSSPSPLILKNNKFSSNSSSLFSYSSPSSSSIQLNNFLDSSSFASSSSSSSGIGSNSSSLNSSPYFNFSSSSSSSSNSSNAFLMALIAAATTTTNCTNLIKNNNEIQQLLKQKEEKKEDYENEEEEKRKQQIIMLKKKARVNFVFNRLSKKVADSVATNENKDDDYLLKENSKEQQKENYKIKNLLIEDNKKSKEFGTQTEEAEDKNEEKCSTNLIRVCCCDDKLKCTEGRRQKRKLLVPMMYGNGGEGVEGEGRKIVGDCCKNRK